MISVMEVLFISLPLSLVFALEGMGITFNRNYFLWFYVIAPSLFYFLVFLKRQGEVRFPAKLGIVAVLSLIPAALSFYYSADKQKSGELMLFSIALFLIFLAGYNHKALVQKALAPVLAVLSVFFSLYSLALSLAGRLGYRLPPVLHEKQTVLAYYPPHNHLGDFLGLCIIFFLTAQSGKKKQPLYFYPVIGTLFIAVLLSGSRSAYLALAAVALLAFLKGRRAWGKAPIILPATAVAAVAFFLAVSMRYVPEKSFFFPAKTVTANILRITPRDLLSGRDVYFGAAFKSIKEKPLFGIGGGSYVTAALSHLERKDYSDSAHNVFLEVAAEQGIPAAILFGLIVVLLVGAAWKSGSPAAFAFLFLLFNFQTDYTYQIYLFPVIAACLAGVFYEESSPPRLPLWAYGIAALVLAVVFVLHLTGSVLLAAGMPAQALRWYPLNKDAYIRAFKDDPAPEEAVSLGQKAIRIAPHDTGVVLAIADYDVRHRKKREALALYESLYRGNKLINPQIIWNIYNLKKETTSKTEADAFLRRVGVNYRQLFSPNGLTGELANTCSKNLGHQVCVEAGWP